MILKFKIVIIVFLLDIKTHIFLPQPIYLPLNRLSAYVDPNQLTYNLGGSKSYDHAAWIQNRVVNTYFFIYSRISVSQEVKMLYFMFCYYIKFIRILVT